VADIVVVNDDMDKIKDAILALKEKGCELIVTTGGMSVDPDDKTPGAIKQTGANVISYGAPVLPGAMFCLAYFEDGTPILGLPGCVMYAKSTIFDLMLPRVAAKIPVTRRDITNLGHGGLCLGCAECRYPACSFGKA
jgi:molybdopterin biosynthesis enzyme